MEIINKAPASIHVQVLCEREFSVLENKYLEMGFWVIWLNVYLAFKETTKLLSRVTALFCIAISNIEEFQVLHIFANARYCYYSLF